ncbi:LytTR family transcriptional regulator DNA-binding domain-containing protein [Flavobacterium amniphilum]|uniref:ligand-binding sensor domain-containing protein n=1 Tax=Flavobacterium amniphilum TaxID=1834035 RepID=UPI00202A0CD8|nr:LytTR family transcriptional regulator DNA-binding domain-containing protein [Flavobacterium amniphilum]MCL9804475.1 LytTR family transcriptional regulator DNA-binding domain-containing protein [Flavobacterium amniphilum]
MKLNYFLSFLFLFVFFDISAQDFINFTTEEGLPSNEVYDVFQDKNGSVWFATDRGLCQYNGYEFKKYAPKDGLTDITIFDFFPQQNGQVWCSTFNKKIFYFENGTNRFVPFKYNHVIDAYIKKYSQSTLYIKRLIVSNNGTVYFCNGGAMFFSIDAKGKLTEHAYPYGKHNKRNDDVFYNNSKYLHTVKIGSNEGIVYCSNVKSDFIRPKYTGVQRQLVALQSDSKLMIADSMVHVYHRNKPTLVVPIGRTVPVAGGSIGSTGFWVGYRNNGLKFYDLNGKCTASYLPHATVSNFIKDCYGGLWISTTDYGVYYLPPNKIRKYVIQNNVIQSLTKDDKNNLFIGTYNGDVYKKEPVKPIAMLRKAEVNFPAFVEFYQKDKIMVSCNGSEMYFNDKLYSRTYTQVTKISDDSPNELSMSMYGLYAVWKDNKRVADTMNFRIHDISRIGNKTYFGTIDGLKISENRRVFPTKKALLKYRIDDLDYSYTNKVLYAATLGKGVVVYDLVTGLTYAIDKSKGLSDDIVTEVYIEDSKTIWACTNYGLNRIRFTGPSTYEVDYITTANGLISNQIKDVEIIKDSIYIGTSKGLCSLSKRQFAEMQLQKHYFLRLKELKVNNKLYAIGNEKKLSLGYDENQLDFGVEAVSFTGNGKIEYRYKLEGLDKSWRNTKERKLSYSYIPPGDYKLLVKVMDDGRSFSNESIVIPVHISKPFWKTFWFIGLMLALLGVVIYFFFKIRVLTYNEDIVRELLRLLLKKIKMKDNYFSFKESGKEIRIKTSDILFVQSSGNYVDIVTQLKTYTVRGKIGDFVSQVQDPLEFLRIHRSFIIRIDKIEQKSKKAVYILHHEIPVGETYLPELDKILF